ATLRIAVSREPVLRNQISLLTGKLTGNFCRIRPSTAIRVADRRADSMAYSQIPYATEQGISEGVSGKMFRGTGNLHHDSPSTDLAQWVSLRSNRPPSQLCRSAGRSASVKMVLLRSRSADRKRTRAKGHDDWPRLPVRPKGGNDGGRISRHRPDGQGHG